MIEKINWDHAPDWADCVIRTIHEDDGRLYWAEPWGTLDGKRQEVGRSRRYSDDIADTSRPNSWLLVATRPKNYGLPDVGVMAFVYDPDGVLMYGSGESGEVIAHIENTAVIRMSYGLGCFTAKHLKTGDQVAALERSRECDKIYGILCKAGREGNRSDMAEAIYDAGYRKQE